jgi:hypothetical protein
LIGVSVDRAGDDATVVISVARSATGHVTHVIQGVTRICLETDEAAEVALQFESLDGTKTVLRFS